MLPSEAAMAGSAVATMVWSTTARNIGSMMDGNSVRKLPAVGGCGSTSSRMAQTVAQDAPGFTSCIREVAKQNRRPAHRTAADTLFVSRHVARYATRSTHARQAPCPRSGRRNRLRSVTGKAASGSEASLAPAAVAHHALGLAAGDADVGEQPVIHPLQLLDVPPLALPLHNCASNRLDDVERRCRSGRLCALTRFAFRALATTSRLYAFP